ncbi:HET-domain-containing protein [Lindgomyces ingoldianus]|uniref:HET-domain-containing protein n=1 Tax=Lindgomyces ingoldianus TaxID=673940 RepID=A0ACB6QMW1_9PLEO|nr:HET-domain-containing protein [Lindgomyces ingoldianus]KAF2467452.1 HET-domain-containing protein [Lindgomyces ingoldianus]
MDSFKYEPIGLKGPAFRLLRLFKSAEPTIECELFQAWLHGDSTIPYEALSYTWGDKAIYEHIRINGRSLGITKNLYRALYNLRSQHTDRILWVDAICIDQANTSERGHQVQQMGKIYSQADGVIFWLGLPTRETNILMDSLNELQKEVAIYPYKDWNPSDEHWATQWSSIQLGLSRQHSGLMAQQRRGMELLLGRPWFKRVWILQEVANSKRAEVCCGTKSIPASFFALAPSLIGMAPESHCQAVLDIMPGLSRKGSWWSQKRDLYTLLLKFKGSKASDERDMIYALLGISSDAHDTDILRADYTKTAKQVVHDAISFLFGHSNFTCHKISELLRNFTSLNTISLFHLAGSHHEDVAAFLKDRGGEVRVTEDVVKAAIVNIRSGKEVIELLLKHKGGEVKITKAVVKAVSKNTVSGDKVMAFLLEQRGEEVVKAAAENIRCPSEVTTPLPLKQQEGEVEVTEDISSERGVMTLLLKQRGSEVKITDGLVTGLARFFSTTSMMKLLEQRGGEVRVTEEVVKAAAGNMESGEDMMALLIKQRGGEIKVTEEVIKAAAENIISGREVMALLLEKRGDEVMITEEVVKAAAGNKISGREVMALLLKQRGREVKITREVVTAALQNTGSGHKVMALLYKQRRSEVNIILGQTRPSLLRLVSILILILLMLASLVLASRSSPQDLRRTSNTYLVIVQSSLGRRLIFSDYWQKFVCRSH